MTLIFALRRPSSSWTTSSSVSGSTSRALPFPGGTDVCDDEARAGGGAPMYCEVAATSDQRLTTRSWRQLTFTQRATPARLLLGFGLLLHPFSPLTPPRLLGPARLRHAAPEAPLAIVVTLLASRLPLPDDTREVAFEFETAIALRWKTVSIRLENEIPDIRLTLPRSAPGLLAPSSSSRSLRFRLEEAIEAESPKRSLSFSSSDS